MKKGSFIWPVIAWAFPILPALSFYWSRWNTLLNPYDAAMFFGYLGLFYFLNAITLSARIRYFDRLYGNGRVLTFHSVMAVAALILILIHRQLKMADGDLVPTGQILIGKIALITLLTAIVTTVVFTVKPWRISRSNRDYSKLKILTDLLPLAGLAAAIHVLLATLNAGFRAQMIIPGAYILTALLLYIRFKFIRPIQLRRNIYTVSEIRRPGENITELRMTGNPLKFKAGQYAYWRIFSGAVGGEEHAFSISSPPGDQEIAFTVEASDHYRSALGKVRVGEKGTVDGPYGQFTLPDDETKPVLLIGGGIGISPFLSMLQDMANSHSMRPVTLIWAVGSREDLVYGTELLKLEKRLPSLRYKPVIEKKDDMQGDGTLADFESGYISKGLIRGLCPELNEDKTLIYICCPDSMKVNLKKIFKSIGVRRRRILRENIILK